MAKKKITTILIAIIVFAFGVSIGSTINTTEKINIENDIYGKYINKFWTEQQKVEKKSNITEEFLRENGF